MEIAFLGLNCVRITGKQLSIICDPYPKTIGLGEIKQSSDAVLLTEPGPQPPGEYEIVIDSPGEYEIRGAMITGVAADLQKKGEESKQGTIYAIALEGVRLVHLGHIDKDLSNSQIESLGQVDVLTIPVGGKGLTLDAQAAAKIISQLEPKYVVPTHYDDGKTKYAADQDKLDVFLKEIGSKPEPQSKLKVSSKDLPLETTVVVLSRG